MLQVRNHRHSINFIPNTPVPFKSLFAKLLEQVIFKNILFFKNYVYMSVCFGVSLYLSTNSEARDLLDLELVTGGCEQCGTGN